jgi:hypothetical protein
MRTYLLHVGTALSQLGNAVLGGYPDETMSSRAWRAEQSGRVFGKILRPTIDVFFIVITLGSEKHHCRLSYQSEQLQLQQTPVLRTP